MRGKMGGWSTGKLIVTLNDKQVFSKRGIGQRNRMERTGTDFIDDRAFEHHRNAEARLDGVLDRLRAAQLQTDPQGIGLLAEDLTQCPARPGAALSADQGRFKQQLLRYGAQ